MEREFVGEYRKNERKVHILKTMGRRWGEKKLVEKMRRRQRVIREDNREKKLVGRYINDTKSSIKTYFLY